MEVHDIFSTAIGHFQLDRELTLQEKEFIAFQTKHSNAGNETSNDYHLHKHEELKELHQFLDACVKKYVEIIYAPKPCVEVRIVQSWLNYTRPGGFHHKHVHFNSLVSGAFYIQADSQHDRITFHKDSYQNMKLMPDKITPYNAEDIWISVGKNQLVIFPSNIFHSVSPVKENRISLGFNAVPIGQVGVSEGISDIL